MATSCLIYDMGINQPHTLTLNATMIPNLTSLHCLGIDNRVAKESCLTPNMAFAYHMTLLSRARYF